MGDVVDIANRLPETTYTFDIRKRGDCMNVDITCSNGKPTAGHLADMLFTLASNLNEEAEAEADIEDAQLFAGLSFREKVAYRAGYWAIMLEDTQMAREAQWTIGIIYALGIFVGAGVGYLVGG